MRETLHKRRLKKYEGEKLNEIYCSTMKNKLSEIASFSKNLPLGLIVNS